MIFVSYSRKDLVVTQLLVDYLYKAGFDENQVFYDFKLNNKPFTEQLTQKIKDCTDFVIILSGSSTKSYWVKREFLYADNLKKNIIVVAINEMEEIPMELIEFNVISLTTRRLTAELDKMIAESLQTKAKKAKSTSKVDIIRPNDGQDEEITEIPLLPEKVKVRLTSSEHQEKLFRLLRQFASRRSLHLASVVPLIRLLGTRDAGYPLTQEQAYAIIDTILLPKSDDS